MTQSSEENLATIGQVDNMDSDSTDDEKVLNFNTNMDDFLNNLGSFTDPKTGQKNYRALSGNNLMYNSSDSNRAPFSRVNAIKPPRTGSYMVKNNSQSEVQVDTDSKHFTLPMPDESSNQNQAIKIVQSPHNSKLLNGTLTDSDGTSFLLQSKQLIA